MNEPTEAQLQSLYRYCHYLTGIMFQPTHIMRIDQRTGNLFILAGQEGMIELEIRPDGSLEDEHD